MRHFRRPLSLVLPAALGLWLGIPSSAQAGIPKELRPGTHPHVWEFGPAFGIGVNGPVGPLASGWTNYLYHFRGDMSGPALGAVLVAGGWNQHASVTTGAMFEWDFQVVPSKPLGVYLGPHVIAGYSGYFHFHDGPDDGPGNGNGHDNSADHWFYSQAGATARLILNDRWSFWVRPTNFEFRVANEFNFSWGASLGAGLIFG